MISVNGISHSKISARPKVTTTSEGVPGEENKRNKTKANSAMRNQELWIPLL